MLGQGLRRDQGHNRSARIRLIAWVKRQIKEICHPGLRGYSRVLQPRMEEAAGTEGVMREADPGSPHTIHPVPCELTPPDTSVHTTVPRKIQDGSAAISPADSEDLPSALRLLPAWAELP